MLAPTRSVSFAKDAPWACTICQHQHTGSEDSLARCDLCGETRRKRPAPSPGPSRGNSCESQTSEASFAGWGGYDDRTELDDSELMQLVEDVDNASAAFNGTVTYQPSAAGAPQEIDLLLGPASVVPKEACTAWGLQPGLRLTLCFESSTDYGERRLKKATLWHPNPKPSGPSDKWLLAGSAGCVVAQQLQQIVHTFWKRLADGGDGVGGVGGGGGGGGGNAGGSSGSSGSSSSTSLQVRRADSRPQAEMDARAVSGGPIGATLLYTRRRLRTLNMYCALCDEPHLVEHLDQADLLLPTVCLSPLCVHQLETFGSRLVGVIDCATHGEVLDLCATHGEVLDLLIATTTLAAASRRAKDIFDPFPTLPGLVPGSDVLALDPAQPERLELARSIFRAFPAFESIRLLAPAGLLAPDRLLAPDQPAPGSQGLRDLMDKAP